MAISVRSANGLAINRVSMWPRDHKWRMKRLGPTNTIANWIHLFHYPFASFHPSCINTGCSKKSVTTLVGLYLERF